ncbi:hypothetical protein KIH86_13480 [Paenibacillus sp. HN-1]|uniref:hypothetical protein n=1 Tax=Paenibacillus TaxID=44249 RepID=UPI001CA9B002|nr:MULTISPECIES: hypothetical protein [Paenibacillus]MBY9080769.1 hypothetical protein [Paenibacillus sp. CGMCC 1.18879]MBY9085239.1 hypothetical protein [Paenibacillus sinensis]
MTTNVSELLFKSVCFAPSEYFGNSPESREFGERIAEVPIIIDYLLETGALSSVDPEKALATLAQTSLEDWWDKRNKEDYVGMLIGRHPHLKNKRDKLMKDNFQWPDISSFKRDRKEYYEIKPHSSSGIRDGRDKMKNLKSMYGRYGLGFYNPGTLYPRNGKKKIKLLSKFRFSLKYLLDLELEAELGVDIFEIYLEVIRKEDGILLYKFCVEFRLKKKKEQLAKYAAARILTHFIRTTTVTLEQEQIRRILTAAGNLEIVEVDEKPVPRREPISAITNVFEVPPLKLRWETVADELGGSKDGIRGAMYSRFIGKPGERYFLCGDAGYYQQVHELPARARMSRTADLLQVHYKMMGLGPRNMAYVTPLLTNISLAEIRQMKEWEAIYQKREKIMDGIAVVCVAASLVVLTAALVVVSTGTGAAALAYGGGSAAAEGTSAAAGGTFAAAEGAGIAGPGVAAGTGATGTASAAGTAAGTAGSAGGTVVSLPIAEAVKDIGMAASIMLFLSSSDAKAAAVPDEVLAGKAQAVPSLPAHVAAVTNQDAWMLRVWTEQGVRKAIEEAVAAGDTGLISLSAAPVYERASESSPGDRLGAPPVGRLYLVKVKDSIGKLPQLYEEFDISGYAAGKQRFTRTRMFGSFTVDSP